jgi:chemotaxis protein CheX
MEKSTFGPAPTHLPAALTEIVKQSVETTIATMCGGTITCVGEDAEDAPCDCLCGIISFVGDLAWSFILGLPRRTAQDMTMAFLGCELDYDSSDMSDAVGEMANILAGDFAARLEELGARASMSLPTVVRGHDVQLLIPQHVAMERLAFDAPAGTFWLKVALSRPVHATPTLPRQDLAAGLADCPDARG